jgi:hypothetical protein
LAHNKVFNICFLQGMWSYNETYSFIAPLYDLQGAVVQYAVNQGCILAAVTNNCFWRQNQNGNRAHNSVIVQSEQQNQRPTTETNFGWGRQNALLFTIINIQTAFQEGSLSLLFSI